MNGPRFEPPAPTSRRLLERPPVVLGHLDDTEWGLIFVGFRETKHYKTFRPNVARPAKGRALVELTCPVCDQRMNLLLGSIEHTELVRRRFFWTAVTAAAVSLGSIAFGLITDYFGYVIPLPSTLGTGLIIAFVVGALVAGIAGYRWWVEDGIQLYSDSPWADPDHRRLDAPGPRRMPSP